MKKVLVIVILNFILSFNAHSEIIKYECYNPNDRSIFESYTRTLNTDTNVVIEEFIWSRSAAEKRNLSVRYNKRVHPIVSIDNTKVIYKLTNENYWEFQFTNMGKKKYNIDNPKYLKKLIKKYGSKDTPRITYTWNYSRDGESSDYYIHSLKENRSSFNICDRIQQIAEKPKDEPKKKQPKQSPDDDKIVPAGSGSGFFVLKDGTVITNYHVIDGCEVNKVSHKGSQSEAKVLSIDKVNDIAILKTDINPQNAFAVSNEDVSLLEDVVVAGYPLGKQISSAIKTHKGVVTALAGAGDNYSYFQTDAAINQGNSGGPIINQKGNVVGIAVQTWVEEGVQGVHFGIKSSTLKTFASANGLKFLTPNNRDLSNKELGKLITESTVYVECHMTIAKIKKMLAEAENKKAFFKEYK